MYASCDATTPSTTLYFDVPYLQEVYVCVCMYVCMYVWKSSHRLSFTISHSRDSHSKIISKLIRIYVCTVQSNAVIMDDDIV